MERYARHYIDGKDIWWAFGVFIESGSDDFLKYPERKDSIEYDWKDSNGIDKDLSNPFFKEKKITLRCAMMADNEDKFWEYHTAFLAEWAKPGTRDWIVAEFRRQFKVYYESCTDFTRFTRIITDSGEKVACKFTLNIIEKSPDFSNVMEFIVDEEGQFIVT